MNKSLTTILVIVALAIVGYFLMQGGTPAASDDSMMKDDAMMEDDSMMNDDAMMEGEVKMEGELMMDKAAQ